MTEAGTIVAHIFLFISLYFEIFLLISFLEGREFENKNKEIKNSGVKKSYPSVTVIVPVFNEEKTLGKTIHSLLSLDYPKELLSIFIVDDGSKDNTWREMEKFKNNPIISLFKKENGGKYTALNLGIEKSASDIVGCLDADSTVDSSALKQIVKRFENKEVYAVTPSIQIHNPKNIIELIQTAEYTFSAFIRRVFSFLGSIYITPGPFSFFRREVFEKIGLYRHAHNTEDLEIGLRMQKNHLKIINAYDAYVYTIAPKTIKSLYKQRVRWIHGFLENAKDYRALFFKSEYGHLSMFILPTATLSIFSSLYFTGFAIWNGFILAGNKVIEFSAVGLGLVTQPPQFDLFFLRSSSIFILTIILITMTLSLILTGKHILKRKVRISKDILYFIFFYSFIAPLWLAKSVYNAVLSKKTSWR